MAGLEELWGPVPRGRTPRVLGVFAHPDDEVFCVGGTFARCADAGATTAVLSLTEGETGQIRDASVATRRTLGAVRAKELAAAASALGVDEVTCLDLGDGQLDLRPLTELATIVARTIDDFRPDVVVTFGPDGGTGHPDHIQSCLATLEAVQRMAVPPRLLYARFPMSDDLLLDVLVDWLTSREQRFHGTAAFALALKLFADGTSLLGVAADHLAVDWFPAGSFLIEQGEPAKELYCILSGSVDVMVEGDDGSMSWQSTVGSGCFVGEDGLAMGRSRNAHVIAREDVTCLVLAPSGPDPAAGRGASAAGIAETSAHARGVPSPTTDPPATAPTSDELVMDVRSSLGRKIAALAAHRSQYAFEPDLFPRPVLERMLGTEHFTVADVPR